MDSLLQAVLRGDWPVAEAVQWFRGERCNIPHALSVDETISDRLSQNESNRFAFQACILEFVSDQVRILLETTSNAPYSSQSGVKSSPKGSLREGRDTAPAPKSKLNRWAGSVLISTASVPEPGALDDARFPPLGSALVSRRLSAASNAPTQASVSGGRAPKRRIVPTSVAPEQLAVSQSFLYLSISEGGLTEKDAPASMVSITSSDLAKGESKSETLLNHGKGVGIPVVPAKPSAACEAQARKVGGSTPKRQPVSSARGKQDPISSAPGKENGTNEQQIQASLTSAGHALAALHVAALQTPAAPFSLTASIVLLLHMLIVPSNVQLKGSQGKIDPCIVFSCAGQMRQYAAIVLSQNVGMLRALQSDMLESIAAIDGDLNSEDGDESPHADVKTVSSLLALNTSITISASDALRWLRRSALDALRVVETHSRYRTEKYYDQMRASNVPGISGGSTLLTSNGSSSRTPEEQRMLKNRESCRDNWFPLLRKGASYLSLFVPSRSGSPSERSSATFTRGDEDPESDVAALIQIRFRATDIIRSLHPDNFIAFAEVIIEAILRAAATGVAVMDAQLTKLAERDLSRFQALNRRMSEAGARTERRLGPTGNAHRPPIGGAQEDLKSTLKGDFNSAKQQYSGRAGPVVGRKPPPSHVVDALESTARRVASIMAVFPEALRPHVLFIEAADSYRLNCSLLRVMGARLQALVQPQTTSSDPESLMEAYAFTDKVIAISALASCIGYLHFTQNSSLEGGIEGDTAKSNIDPFLPSLRDMGQSSVPNKGTLLLKVLWMTNYLRFVRWGALARRTESITCRLRMLASLRAAPELLPVHPSFGRAALCIRSLLDGLDEVVHLTPPELSVELPSQASEMISSGSLGTKLLEMEQLIDVRCLEHCCPPLSRARWQAALTRTADGTMGSNVSDGAPLTSWARPGAAPKKIRPTAPILDDETEAKTRIEATCAVLVARKDGKNDSIKSRLQNEFLDQYSASHEGEGEVNLRRLVEFAADTIGHNASKALVDGTVKDLVQRASKAVDEATKKSPGPLLQHLEEGDRGFIMYLTGLAKQDIISNIGSALELAFEQLRTSIRTAAIRSVSGLASADLGDAVLGTAAAIVAEMAEAVVAKRAVKYGQEMIAKRLIDHAKAAAKMATGKAGGRFSKGPEPACPNDSVQL